jgi:hypothetical protein
MWQLPILVDLAIPADLPLVRVGYAAVDAGTLHKATSSCSRLPALLPPQLTADPCTDRIVATGQVELEKYRGTALLETLLRSPPQFLRRAIAVKGCRTVVVLPFRNVLVLRAQARTNILGKPRLVSCGDFVWLGA